MAKEIFIKQNTDEWMAWRHDGITATDASAIWGTSPWKSVLDIYADKIAPAKKECGGSAAMEWGHRIEPLLIEKFCDVHGIPMGDTKPGILYETGEGGWMKASLDCEAVMGGERIIIECKTGHSDDEWFDKNGKPSVPSFYLSQVMWQMLVSGIRHTFFSVLICGSEWLDREVVYDEKMADELFKKCSVLRGNVQSRTVPPADGRHDKTDLKTAAALYASDTPEDSIELEDVSMADEYHELKLKADEADAKLDACKLKILQTLGKHKTLTYEGKKFAGIVTRAGSVTVDTARLKEEYPDLYEKLRIQGKSSSYITVRDCKV